MPGEPDNIRAASNNSYWVAINLARNGSEKVLFDYLSNKVSNQYVSTLNYLVQLKSINNSKNCEHFYDDLYVYSALFYRLANCVTYRSA